MVIPHTECSWSTSLGFQQRTGLIRSMRALHGANAGLREKSLRQWEGQHMAVEDKKKHQPVGACKWKRGKEEGREARSEREILNSNLAVLVICCFVPFWRSMHVLNLGIVYFDVVF